MKLSTLPAALPSLILLAHQAAPAPLGNVDAEAAASQRILELQAQYQQNVLDAISNRTSGCTAQNIQRRQEWYRQCNTLSPDDRAAFISAIHRLNALPARTPQSTAPGARALYDDFIVAHILQTPFVHASGLFLPFHRHLLHLFAGALRDRCDYAGPLPYWDWTASYADPRAAAVFDGGPHSLGGNGAFVPGRNATVISVPGGAHVVIPPATGGGCVATGPFRQGRFEVRLGPVAFEPRGPQGGLGYNPRCLRRDLSPLFSPGTRPSAVVALLDGCGGDLGCLVRDMDAPGGAPGGVHASGHWQVGPDALDVFASPSDPVFWLHHAQVDRVWTIWQGLDLEGRTYQVWGTSTAANDPPSDDVTLETAMDFGILGEAKTVGEVASTVDGEYCYMYE
ncbi:Di-copper centre-containing protein [Thermothelomyces heterothallicus CBS 203.75]